MSAANQFDGSPNANEFGSLFTLFIWISKMLDSVSFAFGGSLFKQDDGRCEGPSGERIAFILRADALIQTREASRAR